MTIMVKRLHRADFGTLAAGNALRPVKAVSGIGDVVAPVGADSGTAAAGYRSPEAKP